MQLSEALLTILLRLPGPWEAPATAEPPEARQERLAIIAEAIALETEQTPAGWRLGSRRMAAGVLVTWHDEGWRFHRDVHSGKRRGDHRRSVCLGQLRQGLLVSRAEWLASMGTDLEATRMCARLTARVLAMHADRCLSDAPEPTAWSFGKAVAGFGTGHSCNPLHVSPTLGKGWALKRGQRWQWIDLRLEELLGPAREALA
ncbi:MAG TPA: hypothetical protein VM820_01745 [Vicinamibacterales bacterium]|jgi:hypothetical protein|nr:hypothetical protein [Vicinamibacterales bacterium]